MTDSLQATDSAAEAIAVAPRVRLADIESAIGGVYYATALPDALPDQALSPEHLAPLERLTLCLVVMRNGFVVVGKSSPASPENFNQDLGRRFAYDDAIRQLWPLMGFALRERLSAQWIF